MSDSHAEFPLYRSISKAVTQPRLTHKSKLRPRLMALKAKSQKYYIDQDQENIDSAEKLGHFWSKFAERSLDLALKQAWADTPQANRFLDAASHRGPIPGLFVLGLGKLGGSDLNFSSDVDLVSFYDAETIPIPEHAGRSDICARVLRRMTKLLDDRSSGNFIWRVDWRLRPDPSVTDLTMSSAAGENFFFFRAAPWRRLAMMKARPIAGDRKAAQYFMNALHPFIWRRHLDLRALDEIADMKSRIHAEHPGLESARILDDPFEKAADFHLKLGRGGIRDIEFFVNAQQLVWGGREKKLQTGHTLTALAALAEIGIVDHNTASKLRTAYLGLRALENRVQYWSDGHQHHLPTETEKQQWLAVQSGFTDWSALSDTLAQWRCDASEAFDNLFRDEDSVADKPAVPLNIASDLLAKLPEEEKKIAHSWATKGFRPYGVHQSNIDGLTKVGHQLQAIAMDVDDSAAAVQAIHRFLLKLPPGGQYLRLFQERPWLVRQVFKPLILSPAMADLLMQSPHVVDGLVAKPLQGAIEPDIETGRAMLGAASHYDGKLEAARAWVNEQLYRGYLAVFERVMSFEQGEIFLTQLAEGAIALTADIIKNYLDLDEFPLAVLALGKLGMGAMTPRSDLDLIFVAPDELDLDLANKIASRYVSALTAPMREGRIYETDTRLRPSGRSGPPTISFSSFYRHQTDRSKTWELIAQVPMRPILASHNLHQQIIATRKQAIEDAKHRLDLKADAVEMLQLLRQERIFDRKDDPFEVKLSRGGLMEAEYISAYQVLIAEDSKGLISEEFLAAIRILRDSLFAYRLFGKSWPIQVGANSVDDFKAAKKIISKTIKQFLDI